MANEQAQILVITGEKGSEWLQLAADSFARMKRLQGLSIKYFAVSTEFAQVFKINPTIIDDSNWQEEVADIILKLQQSGEVFKRTIMYPVCQKCGNPEPSQKKCSICGETVARVEREGYFFRLQRHLQAATELLSDPELLMPPFQQADAINSIFNRQPEDILLALGINKEKIHYIPVKWFTQFIQILSRCGVPRNSEAFQGAWTRTYIFLPRDLVDNVLYWSGLIIALGLAGPGGFICHSPLQIFDSKGQEVSPMLLAKNYGQEGLRYFILANKIAPGENTFSEDQVIQRINHDLANELGNLVTRVISLVSRFGEGMIPSPDILTRQTGDLELRESALETPRKVEQYIGSQEYYHAIRTVKNLIGKTNRFIETTAPWQLTSNIGQQARLNTILYNLCEALRFLAISLKPILPDAANSILSQLGIGDSSAISSWKSVSQWGLIPAGTRVLEQPALFPRIVPGYGGIGLEQDLIMREDLARIRMIVARVVSAEQVADYEGLLQLILYDGRQRCRVLAPVAHSYKPANLTGKKVVLIANLRPVEVEELHSEGEVLVTEAEPGILQLIFVDDQIPEGRKVLCLS